MLFVADSSGSDVDEEDIESFKEDGMVSEKIAEESRSAGVFNDRNFLDFAGDFSAEISDMESKIDINQLGSEGDNLQESPTAARLFALMSGEENDQWFLERNIDRWEMIGNLKDWIDQDTYQLRWSWWSRRLSLCQPRPSYLGKNAKFDTTDEIRLIEGWHGELFEKNLETNSPFGAVENSI